MQEPGKLADSLPCPTTLLADRHPARHQRQRCGPAHKLADWTNDRRNGSRRMMVARTFLVVVSTPDLSSAHRIFSVMNARGLDLSAADIFKADVIGRIERGSKPTTPTSGRTKRRTLAGTTSPTCSCTSA